MKFESGKGYTGGLFEDDIIPETAEKEWTPDKFYSEEDSYEWVRTHQPWNPSDPQLSEKESNHIANDLHYKVAEALDLEDVNELKLYSARNSPLDRFYGVDAFFEWQNAIFTIDFSINKHKTEYKADIIVSEKDIESEVAMEELAKTIADYLRNRAPQRGKLAA